MSAVPAVRATRDARTPPAPRGRAWVLTLLAIAVTAYLVRLALLTRGGGLLGVGAYDDGVYYAAADALVHGRIPYTDVLFIQPPGAALALAPFAAIGSVTSDSMGFAIGRLVFIGIGAVNAVLVAVVARRFGRTAALVAGGGYALFLPAAYAERSTLLEPLGTLGVLTALVLLGREMRARRVALLAGVALGLAAGVKIWYVVPLAVLLLAASGRRRWVAAGAAAGLAVVYGPFFALDPAGVVRQVVLDQLGRPRGSVGSFRRVALFLGAPEQAPGPLLHVVTTGRVGLVLVVVAAVLTIAAAAVRGARTIVVLLIVDAVVLVASPSWFPHYGALTAPMLAIVAGVGAQRLLRRLRSRRLRGGAVAALLVAVAALTALGSKDTDGPVPIEALRPALDRIQGCVVADDPTALVVLDVLSRDFARGCAVRVDVTGYTYDSDQLRRHGHFVSRTRNPVWQHDVLRYLGSADASLVIRNDTGLSAASRRRIDAAPVLAGSGIWVLHGPFPVP